MAVHTCNVVGKRNKGRQASVRLYFTTACPCSYDRKTKNNGLTLLEHLAKARSLLKPYPEELMNAHDVSTIVNSAKYDGPECIQPVSDDEIPRGGQLSLL